MPGYNFVIEGIDDLQNFIDATLRYLKDPSTTMAFAGFVMLEDIMTHFERQEGSDGKQWKPSRRVREQGGETLRNNGTLKQSIMTRHTSRNAEVGTNLEYASVHNYGNPVNMHWIEPVRRKTLHWIDERTGRDRFSLGHYVWTNGQKMPKREFMWLSDRAIQRIGDKIVKELEEL